MNVFFDTEFTNLLNPKLISIGFTSAGGRSLYLELLDWTPAECSDFVREVVLPLLDQPRRMSVHEAANIILAHFKSLEAPLRLMADSSIDFQFLGKLFHDAGQDKPSNLAEGLIISPTVEGEIIREGLYAAGLRRHHALDDAEALMAAWKKDHG